MGQNSFSTSLDPNISKVFSGENKVGIVKIELSPNANIVTIDNELYAEDIERYAQELKGVDAVFLRGTGEKEVVILNKDIIKIVDVKDFKVSDKIIQYHRDKNTPYKKGTIAPKVFNQLIAKLKKTFSKAFENLYVTTDWNEFVQKANEYHNKKQGIERQIIGEKGAEQLDYAEEVTHRMDNLSVAREMETAGKSPKEIRLATGWERGADNKWRYEIPDLNIRRENVYDETGKRIAIPTAKQWFEYHNRKNESLQPLYLKDFKPTEKEIDSAEFLGYELSKIIDIYPELGEIRIIVHPKEKSIAQAFYSPKLRLISFREDSRSFDEDFIHEIQHAIQDIEGFTQGGTPEDFIDNKIDNYINKYEKTHNELTRSALSREIYF